MTGCFTLVLVFAVLVAVVWYTKSFDGPSFPFLDRAARSGSIFFIKRDSTSAVDPRSLEKSFYLSRQSDALTPVLEQLHSVVRHRIVGTDERYFDVQIGDGSLSPDGRRVAYVDADGLFVRRVDGQEWARVAPDGAAPLWSPDGRLLAYLEGSDLKVADAVGAGQRTLASGDGLEPMAWSPLGDRVLYLDGSRLVDISANGGDSRVVTPEADLLELPPQWSADGGSILAGWRGENGVQLVSWSLESGEMRDLIVWDRPGGVRAFAVSPAGKDVAFVAEACFQKRGDFGIGTFEHCDLRLFVAGRGGRGKPRKVEGVVAALNEEALDLVWAPHRPPNALGQALFDQRDVEPRAAASDQQQSAEGMIEPVPLGHTVTTEGWSARVLQVLSDEAAVDLLKSYPSEIQVSPDGRYLAVEVEVGFRGAEGSSQKLTRPHAFDLVGKGFVLTTTGHRGILGPYLDPRLNVRLAAADTIQGWLFVRLLRSNAEGTLVFEPGEPPGSLRRRYLSLREPPG